jgi:hypothetical protein
MNTGTLCGYSFETTAVYGWWWAGNKDETRNQPRQNNVDQNGSTRGFDLTDRLSEKEKILAHIFIDDILALFSSGWIPEDRCILLAHARNWSCQVRKVVIDFMLENQIKFPSFDLIRFARIIALRLLLFWLHHERTPGLSVSKCRQTFCWSPQIAWGEFNSRLMDICHEGTNCCKPVTARKKSTSINSILTSFAVNTSYKPWSYSNWRQTPSFHGHSTVKTIESFTELREVQTKIKFLTTNFLWLTLPRWCFFSNSMINHYGFISLVCLHCESEGLIWSHLRGLLTSNKWQIRNCEFFSAVIENRNHESFPA